MNALKVIKNTLYIVFACIILFLITCNCIIIAKSIINPNELGSILNYKSLIIISESMEDTLNKNDLIIIKDNIVPKLGDIVAYKKDNYYVSHRIVEIKEEGNEVRYITKGDTNNINDEGYLTIDDIEGVYVYKIEKIGQVLLFLQTPAGIIVTILIIVTLYTIYHFSALGQEKKENDEETDKLKKEIRFLRKRLKDKDGMSK